METSSFDVLQRQIDRLESECRRWKLMSLSAFLVGILFLGVCGAQFPPPKPVPHIENEWAYEMSVAMFVVAWP